MGKKGKNMKYKTTRLLPGFVQLLVGGLIAVL